MILSYFNSYIEVFVALNLGYAAFGFFRETLETNVFKIQTISNKLFHLKSRLNAQISGVSESNDLKNLLENIQTSVNIEEESLSNMEERDRWFFEILKPLSFLLSLLCLSYLIIAGFQEAAGSIDEKQFFSDYFFILSSLVSVFTIIVFFLLLFKPNN